MFICVSPGVRAYGCVECKMGCNGERSCISMQRLRFSATDRGGLALLTC